MVIFLGVSGVTGRFNLEDNNFPTLRKRVLETLEIDFYI